MKDSNLQDHFSVDDRPTVEEINLIRGKLNAYNREQTNGVYDKPGIKINLALKTPEDEVLGWIIVSTMLNVMHLEVLWVADPYRKNGYGRELVLEAERIGYEQSCITSHTWTFEFHGPEFYPKIGYRLAGVYDGYPNELKEYVFPKRLGNHKEPIDMKEASIKSLPNGLYITENVTKEIVEILHAGLRSHVDQYVGDEKNGIGIKLVIRDGINQIIGGLHAWTTIQICSSNTYGLMSYRGIGVGTKLLMEAESIAKKNACIASLACSLSFQNPGFFEKMGYQIFGYSDGYPDPIRENYLIKKYAKKRRL